MAVEDLWGGDTNSQGEKEDSSWFYTHPLSKNEVDRRVQCYSLGFEKTGLIDCHLTTFF